MKNISFLQTPPVFKAHLQKTVKKRDTEISKPGEIRCSPGGREMGPQNGRLPPKSGGLTGMQKDLQHPSSKHPFADSASLNKK